MKRTSTLRWLRKHVEKRLPALTVLIVANVVMALLGVAFALGTKNIVNSAVGGNAKALLSASLWQLAVIAAIVLVLTLQRYLHSRMNAELDRDWKQILAHKILHGDFARVSDFHTGELLNRMNNDVRAVDEGLLTVLPNLASIVTRLVAVVAVLLVLQPMFTLILLGVGLVLAVITTFARRYLRELNKRVSEADGKVSGFFQEAFEKLIFVQGMNVEDEVERRGDKLLDARFGLQKKRWKLLLLSNTGVSLMGYVFGFAALVFCAFGIYKGTMDFGELTAVTHLVSQLHAPLVNISGIVPKYIAMTAAAERLMELEEICGSVSTSQVEEKTLADFTEICAENLNFSYGRDVIFEDSSICVPRGAFAVVTGASGIGKSTLLKLLLGIFAPDAGKLWLRCKDSSVPLSKDTRRAFAYVPQGNLIFSGTLRENLLITKPEATEEEIQRVVNLSCMDAFLPTLPEGLDTVIGENAHGLSEGQAQRLSIARALLSDAPILLLDECTSALDEDTEAAVLRRICELTDKTCIVVSHKPAALSLAGYHLTVENQQITCKKVN